MLSFVLTFCGASLFLLLGWVHLVSRRENERTAARRSLTLAILLGLVFLLCAWVPFPGSGLVGWTLVLATAAGVAAVAIPNGRPAAVADPIPPGRIDERTIMFSRAALEPGTQRYEGYYEEFPQHRPGDERFRSLPGLMSPAAKKFEPLSFAAAGASFETVEQLAALVEGEPSDERVSIEPRVATDFLEGWATKLGAVSCGVTELRDEHTYAIKGRGPGYGAPIDLIEGEGHRWAVAFTVEMDHGNLGTAPEGPTLMESAQQYLEAGAIAVQIAACLRRLGWKAEAHIDANYRVVCPLVARDAGLGEIGRMGLLMTPTLGPRVRIAVVTTDLPLLPSPRRGDPTVLHFCEICRKCADICPPRAIPDAGPVSIDGVKRWQVDQEACYAYWCAMGTDCGQCMKVCPYSHPDNALHNLVRWGLRRSGLFRHLALRMDDLLYGRRPGPMASPSWLPHRRSAPD
jgi:reductive dehalogenase